jgi:hypothetical protein
MMVSWPMAVLVGRCASVGGAVRARSGTAAWRRRQSCPTPSTSSRRPRPWSTHADKLRQAGVAVTADRFHAIIHDFVMLNALADTNAARGAITLATDTLRTGLSDKS